MKTQTLFSPQLFLKQTHTMQYDYICPRKQENFSWTNFSARQSFSWIFKGLNFELIKRNINSNICQNVMVSQTYPAGRQSTAARTPVVLRRSIGCPVTKLFQEYGSATSVPGFTTGGGGFSPPIEPVNSNILFLTLCFTKTNICKEIWILIYRFMAAA